MATTEDVLKLAQLARITVPAGEAESFSREFQSIVDYIGQLDDLSIETKGDPLVPVLHNVTRPDESPYTPGSFTDAITAQFPAREGDALLVKKIITHE